MLVRFRTALAVVGFTLAPALWAASDHPEKGTPGAPSNDSPLNMRAPISPQRYDSAFQNYRPFEQQEIHHWQEANDEVGRIGGWKAYAKEAQSGGESKDASNPSADPHAGHKME